MSCDELRILIGSLFNLLIIGVVMEGGFDVFITKILPVVSALVTVIGLFKGWVITRQVLFEQREKLSKHSYEIYKICGEESLKNLSVEYGYAAITKDNFLTLEQRKALIQSKNPTRDIDLFIKLRNLLAIDVSPLRFRWKKDRLSVKWYFYGLLTLQSAGYVFSSVIMTVPFTGEIFLYSSWLEKINSLPTLNIIAISIYCFVSGGFFSYFFLNSAAKLLEASWLIQQHECVILHENDLPSDNL